MSLQLQLENGESLDVRSFKVTEAISRPFRVDLVAVSMNHDLDFEGAIGRPAVFRLTNAAAYVLVPTRTWVGICTRCEQTRIEAGGLSTYELTIESQLWALVQRRNHRVFQHLNVPAIVARIFSEWQIEFSLEVDPKAHAPLEFRIQYGETDLAFVSRLLEEAGISYVTVQTPAGMKVVLRDAPQAHDKRAAPPLSFVDSAAQAQAAQVEYATLLRFRREARPGKVVLRDFDFRNPRFDLEASASIATGNVEESLEVYRFAPGRFLTEGHAGGETPAADDRGVARYHQPAGTALATRLLEAERVQRRAVSFRTNAFDLAPGVVFNIANHPKTELFPTSWLLSTELVLSGEVGFEWTAEVRAVFADAAYRPELSTAKPSIYGVQSAIVVGPEGDKVHTDEFGRVRVQFVWDRAKHFSDLSSCWVRVSQAWAGTGYGHVVLPRVGHEVLVGFVDGNPDQPIVVGRVFNGAQQTPYKLPGSKLISAWKSDSNSNIIVFDDTAGEEGFYTQAEKDRVGIVKKDETYLTGGKRTLAIKKAYKTLVGDKQDHFAGKDYKMLAGNEWKSQALIEWGAKAGLEAGLKSGKDISIAVQPVVPFVMALIDVFQAKAKLKKLLPDGPPDLSAVLPDFTKGGITVKSGAVSKPKKLSKEQVESGMADVINLFGLALKGKSKLELSELLDEHGLEKGIELLLAGVKDSVPKSLLKLTDLDSLLDHLQSLLAGLADDDDGKKGSEKAGKKKKKKEEGDFNLIDLLQDIAQAILDKIVPKTKIELEHQKITIATDKAKIELSEDSIKLKADKDIEIKAGGCVKIEGASVKIKPSPCKCK